MLRKEGLEPQGSARSESNMFVGMYVCIPELQHFSRPNSKNTPTHSGTQAQMHARTHSQTHTCTKSRDGPKCCQVSARPEWPPDLDMAQKACTQPDLEATENRICMYVCFAHVQPQMTHKVARPRDGPNMAKPDLAMTPEAVREHAPEAWVHVRVKAESKGKTRFGDDPKGTKPDLEMTPEAMCENARGCTLGHCSGKCCRPEPPHPQSQQGKE